MNYMLALFEKLYKYAEEPGDKIPIRICEVKVSRTEMKTNPDGLLNRLQEKSWESPPAPLSFCSVSLVSHGSQLP